MDLVMVTTLLILGGLTLVILGSLLVACYFVHDPESRHYSTGMSMIIASGLASGLGQLLYGQYGVAAFLLLTSVVLFGVHVKLETES